MMQDLPGWAIALITGVVATGVGYGAFRASFAAFQQVVTAEMATMKASIADVATEARTISDKLIELGARFNVAENEVAALRERTHNLASDIQDASLRLEIIDGRKRRPRSSDGG